MRATPGDDHAESDDRDAFDVAGALLATAIGPEDDLCSPFLRPTAASGAVISTLGDPLGIQTLGATDEIAARIDEIQIDLGEGPCWEALRLRRPVMTANLHRDEDVSWPAARAALRDLDIAGLYAFPLVVGGIGVGSVDLYARTEGSLSERQVRGVTVLASIAARQVLRRALEHIEDGAQGVTDGPYSRREMHQASGMIAAQLSIDVDDALVLLRGHAYAAGRSVLDVATDVVERRLDFRAPAGAGF